MIAFFKIKTTIIGKETKKGEEVMKLKLLILTLAMVMVANTAFAIPLKGDAKTKRIPAGTKLKLELIDPITTYGGQEGDYFNAMLLEDQKTQSSVILPAGSVIRGSVSKIVPTKRLSRGAILYLDFDHVVTPNGRQLPLALSVFNRVDLADDGGIYGSKGYGQALQKNWARSVEITKNATAFGSDIGDNSFEGAKFITVPLCAVGGAFGGGAFLVGDSIIDLFRKGDNVLLNQGTVLDVMLINPIDVPVN